MDQACSVKMAGYWPRSFFRVYDLDFVSVHKHAKNKKLGLYPAILTSRFVNNPYILTEQVWVINDLLTLFLAGHGRVIQCWPSCPLELSITAQDLVYLA